MCDQCDVCTWMWEMCEMRMLGWGGWADERGEKFLLQVEKSYGLVNLLHAETQKWSLCRWITWQNITRSYIRERQIEARRGNSFWLTIPYWQLLIVIKPVSAITLIVPVPFSLSQTKTQGRRKRESATVTNEYTWEWRSWLWFQINEQRMARIKRGEREKGWNILWQDLKDKGSSGQIELSRRKSEWKRIAVFIKVASWCRLD